MNGRKIENILVWAMVIIFVFLMGWLLVYETIGYFRCDGAYVRTIFLHKCVETKEPKRN